jgi:lipopolysaccharide export system permease protein
MLFLFAENISVRSDWVKSTDNLSIATENKTTDLLSIFNYTEKAQLFEIVKNNLSSTEFTVMNAQSDLEFKKKNINSHWIVYYEKFMIAYSCLLMFFIGAPLGAIIRKGGVGLPMVFAVIIFITFHFINTFGRKLAQEDGIHPFLGVWMASLLLTPFAIMLTYRATNDIGLMISFDWITEPIKKIFGKYLNNNNN